MASLAELYPAYGLRPIQLGLGGQQQGGLGALGAFGTQNANPMSALAAYGAPQGQLPPQSTAPPAGGTDLARAMEAISRIESGGRYDLLGPVTRNGDRAYGRYQVMGANIPQWTERHLGRRLTPDEFLADRQAQDAVFRAQFGMYLNRHGPQDAASMWFTGQPYSIGQTRTDAIPGVHRGLTGAEYVRRFLAGLN